MTCYRAGIASDHSWYVEQSPDGIHAEVIATRLPSAKSARCFIDAREGRLPPTRVAADVAPPASAATRVGRSHGGFLSDSPAER
jgi:hypothetical protein